MNEEQILEAALHLPRSAQLRIAEALRQDLCDEDPEFKASVLKKLNERRQAYKEGRAGTMSAEESLSLVKDTIDGDSEQSSPN